MSQISSDEAALRCDTRGRVRLLTLNRPAALNAFNDDLYDAVRDALLDAAGSKDVATVVLTGEGRAFTAGQDLGELAERRRHNDGKPHGFEPFMDAVTSFPKPLLAAVNGIGVGIGLTLLPHCDLVFMAEEARVRAPFVSLGVTAEAGSTWLLPARIGWQATAHLLYTAAWMSAQEALQRGLAYRVCPLATLLEETLGVAQEIARMPIDSLVATKQLLLEAQHDALEAARQHENQSFAALRGGPANREALAAFRERRSPDFTKL